MLAVTSCRCLPGERCSQLWVWSCSCRSCWASGRSFRWFSLTRELKFDHFSLKVFLRLTTDGAALLQLSRSLFHSDTFVAKTSIFKCCKNAKSQFHFRVVAQFHTVTKLGSVRHKHNVRGRHLSQMNDGLFLLHYFFSSQGKRSRLYLRPVLPSLSWRSPIIDTFKVFELKIGHSMKWYRYLGTTEWPASGLPRWPPPWTGPRCRRRPRLQAGNWSPSTSSVESPWPRNTSEKHLPLKVTFRPFPNVKKNFQGKFDFPF